MAWCSGGAQGQLYLLLLPLLLLLLLLFGPLSEPSVAPDAGSWQQAASHCKPTHWARIQIRITTAPESLRIFEQSYNFTQLKKNHTPSLLPYKLIRKLFNDDVSSADIMPI
jgi:hypothetical protein